MQLFKKPEPRLVPEYSDLPNEQREKAEAVYKAYREAVEGKSWRKVDGEDTPGVDLDPTVEVMHSNNSNTAKAWIHYALNVPPGDAAEIDMTRAEALFEEHFRTAAKLNYNNGNIPAFDVFADKTKGGWLAAAIRAATFEPTEAEAKAEDAAPAPAASFSP